MFLFCFFRISWFETLVRSVNLGGTIFTSSTDYHNYRLHSSCYWQNVVVWEKIFSLISLTVYRTVYRTWAQLCVDCDDHFLLCFTPQAFHFLPLFGSQPPIFFHYVHLTLSPTLNFYDYLILLFLRRSFETWHQRNKSITEWVDKIWKLSHSILIKNVIVYKLTNIIFFKKRETIWLDVATLLQVGRLMHKPAKKKNSMSCS